MASRFITPATISRTKRPAAAGAVRAVVCADGDVTQPPPVRAVVEERGQGRSLAVIINVHMTTKDGSPSPVVPLVVPVIPWERVTVTVQATAASSSSSSAASCGLAPP